MDAIAGGSCEFCKISPKDCFCSFEKHILSTFLVSAEAATEGVL